MVKTHLDFRDKIRKALDIKGFRFFLIHAPCPTGWKTEPAESIELVSLAVRSGVFPLYEVFDGIDFRINAEPDDTDPAQYYEKQRRFSGQEINLRAVKRSAKARIEWLRHLAGIQLS